MTFLFILFWASLLFILYTYIGYPLLIAILARLFPDRTSYSEYLPHLTFLIPAYNEEAYISKKLENTLSLNYPPDKLQILVVADGSTDETPGIVKSYKDRGVELAYIPDRNGKMAAIVRAMQFARGEIVVFSDANNIYDPEALRELTPPFSDSRVGATTGAKFIIEDGRDLSSAEGLYWKYESFVKKNESIIDSCVSSVGEILAIRRDIFVPPREKIVNDDHYIVLNLIRRGYRVIYTPRARSYEYVSLTARDEVERRKRMNAGLYQTISMSKDLLPFNRPLILWQIISHKYFRAFVPFAFPLLLGSNALLLFLQRDGGNGESFLSLPSSPLFYFLFLQLIFYMMAVLGNWLRFTGRLGKLFYLPTFLVNSNLATVMGLYHFLTNKQSHIWNRVRR
jgi:cellulose synthase/poly-beta-1,6-N-acetylglucosamine synthase-like glycosyltransferase